MVIGGSLTAWAPTISIARSAKMLDVGPYACTNALFQNSLSFKIRYGSFHG
jgi:hypothetical protein